MTPQRKTLVTVAVIVIVIASAVGALMVFNKSPNLLDSEFRVIVTNSMDGEPREEYEIKTIPVNSLVAIHKVHNGDVDDIRIGDVIGFYQSSVHGNTYHRVVAVDEAGKSFTTRGDNTHASEHVPFGDVNGKVVNVSPTAGHVVVYLQHNILFVLAVIVILIVMVEAVSYILKLGKE